MAATQYSSQAIAAVRELAKHFSVAELQACMEQQHETGNNGCHNKEEKQATMNLLAKAGFVASQMTKGLSLNKAMRELGRRMRVFLESAQ